MRWPARVKAGRKWSGPVCQTDLLATFAEMLGEDLPDGAGEDSVSFYHVLTDEKPAAARLPIIHHSSRGRFAIREGRWKLVMETNKQPRELYDLSTDPGETRNRLDDNPPIVAELARRITAIVENGRTTPGKPVSNDTPFWSDLTWIKY